MRHTVGLAAWVYWHTQFQLHAGSYAQLALGVQPGLQHLSQARANRQSQTCAAKCIRPFHPEVRLKHTLHVFRRHANSGIYHLKPQADLLLCSHLTVQAQQNTARLGELDGVVDKVIKHLPHQLHMPQHTRRGRGIHHEIQLQALALSTHGETGHHLLHQLQRGKRSLLQRLMPGFNARQIQRVVHSGQQCIR